MPSGTSRPTAVVHLAALSSVGGSWGNSAETWQVNLVGTVNLLDALFEAAPRRAAPFRLDRRGLRSGAGAADHREREARAALAVCGLEGRRRNRLRTGRALGRARRGRCARLPARRARAGTSGSRSARGRGRSPSSSAATAASCASATSTRGAGHQRRPRCLSRLPAAARSSRAARDVQHRLGSEGAARRDRRPPRRAGAGCRSASCSIPTGCGRATSRSCGATRRSCTRRPAGTRRSRSSRLWPTPLTMLAKR